MTRKSHNKRKSHKRVSRRHSNEVSPSSSPILADQSKTNETQPIIESSSSTTSSELQPPAIIVSSEYNAFFDNQSDDEETEGALWKQQPTATDNSSAQQPKMFSTQTIDQILSPNISCFAGLSPSNNVFEEDDFLTNNNSFDDPFDADFIDDNDFETFSFNDMEDIFDHSDSHSNYETSETEVSEDEAKRTNFLQEDQDLAELDAPLNNDLSFSDISQFYNGLSDEDDDEDSFEIQTVSHGRAVRVSKSLDSFPEIPKRLFTPNKSIQPTKSSLKYKSDDTVTFIVSAQNGNNRDATRYATELNSDNGRGIPFPSHKDDTVCIAANQTKRNRKKHKKAAIIKAQEVIKCKSSKETTATQKDKSGHVGFYTENALKNYLRSKSYYGLFRKGSSFKDQSNSLNGGMKQLRKYNSSIQLNESKNMNSVTSHDLKLITKEYSLNSNQSQSTKTKKKSVKWASKLEW
ncbi:hypothetical protein DASC09_049480 [Saccharomycopsis crataegensis]|uniref:Uncharacterized protein n=1 Tax=Saccharomycopsis crataegensis TaxID=43959 RepID=A0AAV5QRT5_9ASCO|nr:hypothetical protein DASC09_049480 [Saccharomycopsis crataegensis]